MTTKKPEQEFNSLLDIQIVVSVKAASREEAERKIDAVFYSTIKDEVDQADSKFFDTLPTEIDGVQWRVIKQNRHRVERGTLDGAESKSVGQGNAK
jgi:hypothetical protein